MFDTLLIGTSGLLGHAKGLRVVGNNLSNVNTPGFKSAQLQFGSLFEQGASGQGAVNYATTTNHLGTGMETLGSKVSFQAGLDQSTGNTTDVLIDGDGFFTVERDGQLLYTRAGDFHFDNNGVLVNGFGDHVKGLSSGKLVDVTLEGLQVNEVKKTTAIDFSGTISSKVTNKTSTAEVINSKGEKKTVSFTFGVNSEIPPKNVLKIAQDGVNSQEIVLTSSNGAFDPNSVNYEFGGQTIVLNLKSLFVRDAPSAPIEAPSLAVIGSNVSSTISNKTITKDGILQIEYTNGVKSNGNQLALANFNTEEDLEQLSGGVFKPKVNVAAQYGVANKDGFGSLLAGHREGSNVDLAAEFSNLILMQRGYQASSHVISTANDMIQQLFDMKGNR